jgi:hypothetical protein
MKTPHPNRRIERNPETPLNQSHESSPDESDFLPPEEPSELDEIDLNDERWEAFLADDDERDPQPQPGDFWPED